MTEKNKEQFVPIKTWIRINNVEVVNYINQIKKNTKETYPNIINTLLFRATTQEEFNEKDNHFISNSYDNLIREVELNFVQGIKNRDEILYKLDEIIALFNHEDFDSKRSKDDFKIFQLFYLDGNKKVDEEVSSYLEKYNLILQKEKDEKNNFTYSIFNEKKIKVLLCESNSFIMHDSDGFHNYNNSNMSEMIMKININSNRE